MPKDADKVPAKNARRRVSPLIEGLGLYEAILVDCNLDWNPQENGEHEAAKAEQVYDGVLRLIQQTKSEKTTIASCDFSAGQRIKDKNIFQVRCTYLIAIHHKDDNALSAADRKKLLRETAEVSAWSLFRGLFAHIVSQTLEELPLLPNSPKLRWLGSEEGAKEKAATD